jgi:hypothetical protein
VEIRADRIGSQALREGLGRRFPREAAAPVTDVEPYAPGGGLVGFGQDPTVVVADPGARGGERVRQHVARPQPAQRGRDIRALGDVRHQGNPCELGSRQRSVEGCRHVDAARLAPEPDLDADRHVPMLADDRRSLARARVPKILQLAHDGRDQPGRGDVDVGQHADRRRLDRVPAERCEVREPGRSGIDGRRDAAAQVGDRVDAVRAAVVPVAVQIDEPGQDEQTGDVDQSVLAGRRLAGQCLPGPRDRLDAPVVDDDIEDVIETGARVEDAAAMEDRSGHAALLSRFACRTIEPTGRFGRDRTHRRGAA